METALTNAANQTNFTPLDWVIVAVYLVLSVSIAFFVKRYAGNMTNFVSAGRAVGTWLGIATLTGTEMGLITVMYSAQKGFKTGFAAFHIGVIAGFVAFLIGVTGFIVVRLREHKVLTIPEYYEKRYGRRTRILGGIMLAFGGLLNMGLFLKVGAMFIVGITGMVPDSGAVNAVMIVLLALVLVYTVIGGMISVVITDYIQFVILSVGILVTGWLAIEHVGWDNLFETVRTHKGEAGFNPVAAKSDFGWEYVGWMFFLGIVNCALWPTAVARALAMESTTALKRQYTWSSISFAIRIIIPNLLGVCAFVFVITKAPDLQQLFSPADADVKAVDNLYAMPIFLGRILPAGLIGLITAAMIAAFMSTHDGYLLCWSTVITQDIIAPLFKERLDNPTRIKITRILIVLIGLYILYWGLFYTGEEDIWDYMAVTGAIYFTGAFSLLVGGLYRNRYIEVLRKYAVFNGRSRRKEYWYFALFNYIITIVLLTIDAEAGMGLFLSGIYTLAVLIPGMAVTVRRLHDTDRSGWWLLIALIPLIGAIVLLVFMVQDSKPGKNQYASNPKDPAHDTALPTASSTGAVLALLVGITAVFGLGPVQQAIHTWIPGSIAELKITAIDDDTVEFNTFELPEEKEEFFPDFVRNYVKVFFEQAKPWRFNGLKGWTAVMHNAAGQAQAVEVRTSDPDAVKIGLEKYWEAEASVFMRLGFNKAFVNVVQIDFDHKPDETEVITKIEKKYPHLKVEHIRWIRERRWPNFEPQTGDTVSFYKLLSGQRVGLMTIGFTLFVFILGSLIFPDRKQKEAANE